MTSRSATRRAAHRPRAASPSPRARRWRSARGPQVLVWPAGRAVSTGIGNRLCVESATPATNIPPSQEEAGAPIARRSWPTAPVQHDIRRRAGRIDLDLRRDPRFEPRSPPHASRTRARRSGRSRAPGARPDGGRRSRAAPSALRRARQRRRLADGRETALFAVHRAQRAREDGRVATGIATPCCVLRQSLHTRKLRPGRTRSSAFCRTPLWETASPGRPAAAGAARATRSRAQPPAGRLAQELGLLGGELLFGEDPFVPQFAEFAQPLDRVGFGRRGRAAAVPAAAPARTALLPCAASARPGGG